MTNESKRTMVLGASDNPTRYSYLATIRLKNAGYQVVPLGNRPGQINGVEIETAPKDFQKIHTITLYLNPQLQKQYYEYILSLSPQRIIFNPGTENPELMQLAREAGIEVVSACTLVMLSTSQY